MKKIFLILILFISLFSSKQVFANGIVEDINTPPEISSLPDVPQIVSGVTYTKRYIYFNKYAYWQAVYLTDADIANNYCSATNNSCLYANGNSFPLTLQYSGNTIQYRWNTVTHLWTSYSSIENVSYNTSAQPYPYKKLSESIFNSSEDIFWQNSNYYNYTTSTYYDTGLNVNRGDLLVSKTQPQYPKFNTYPSPTSVNKDGGQLVSWAGSNFPGDFSVTFCGQSVEVTYQDDTEVDFYSTASSSDYGSCTVTFSSDLLGLDYQKIINIQPFPTEQEVQIVQFVTNSNTQVDGITTLNSTVTGYNWDLNDIEVTLCDKPTYNYAASDTLIEGSHQYDLTFDTDTPPYDSCQLKMITNGQTVYYKVHYSTSDVQKLEQGVFGVIDPENPTDNPSSFLGTIIDLFQKSMQWLFLPDKVILQTALGGFLDETRTQFADISALYDIMSNTSASTYTTNLSGEISFAGATTEIDLDPFSNFIPTVVPTVTASILYLGLLFFLIRKVSDLFPQ